jgi:hypothetical protein
MVHPKGCWLLPLLITAFALSACSGGGGSGTAPSATLPAGGNTTSSAGANSGSGNVQLSITLPGTGTAAKLRKPAFVSGGTAGALIVAYLSTDTTHANPVGSTSVAVGLGAPGCSSSAPITCLVPITVPPSPSGSSTAFVVTLYNQAPTNGAFPTTAQVLGLGNATQVVTANGSNSLTVSVLGVPASGVLVFPPSASVPGGSASSYPLTVTALDAASQSIQGTFASPVQLTTTNSAITSFTVNGQPGALIHASTDSVVVSYNGGPGSANLSLTGTAPNFTAAPFSFIPSSAAPTASPASVIVQIFGQIGSTATFIVSEPNYTGAGYTETDNCAQYTPPHPTTISPTVVGGSTATFTVNGGSVPGYQNCTAIIVDAVGQTLSVIVQIQNNT